MTFPKIPRLGLFSLLVLGAVAVVYVMIAASVKKEAPGAPGADRLGAQLLVGDVKDFTLALSREKAPSIAFEQDGKEVALKDFSGKVLLVNFWATWCAPCLKELPSLDGLERDLGGPDFAVVAIAADARGPEIAAQYLKKLDIGHLKLYRDPMLRLTSAIGGANVLPVSILYDRKGREIGRMVGEADWSSAEARRLVKAAIAAE